MPCCYGKTGTRHAEVEQQMKEIEDAELSNQDRITSFLKKNSDEILKNILLNCLCRNGYANRKFIN